METFILIMLMMFCGYLFKRFNIFPAQTPQVLNLFIIYVSLPAMVLLYVPKITFSSEMLIPIMISWVTLICGAITIYILSKIFNWDKKTTGVLLLVGVLGNTSFLGIPIVSYYFGVTALPYVMIYDQLGSFLALSTYGAIIVAIYSSDDRIYIKHIIKKVITFPPFIALIIAFFLQGIEFNTGILNNLELLANTLVPIALISVGYSLQLKVPKDEFSAFSMGLITKLILIPIYAFIIVYIFSLEGLAVDVSILESAMGPMITAGILATNAGFSARLSSSIIGYGILLSFITTAGVVFILGV